MRVWVPVILLLFGVSASSAQTAAPGQTCENKNSTNCEDCLQNTSCLWCIKTQSCITYPVRSILPPQSLCPLNDARWGLCSSGLSIQTPYRHVIWGCVLCISVYHRTFVPNNNQI
uniref:PSI domain-containing protein n=1 Tax=Astyanax mexicanus TaxID=7994 RepID=A0A3B1IMM6_ASTMX